MMHLSPQMSFAVQPEIDPNRFAILGESNGEDLQ